MRAVVQRVRHARVHVDGKQVGAVGNGLCVLLGVSRTDTETDIEYMVRKIPNLRIFEDKEGKMNKSLRDVGGSVLLVSQFTLYGDCSRGLRPSYTEAAPPELAEAQYNALVERLRGEEVTVKTGVFRAMMDVEILNHGPVTIILDSRRERGKV